MKNKKTLFISVYDVNIERTKLKKILRTVDVLHHGHLHMVIQAT